MRLNGWQRAWVVLSVVWIAAISSVAITSQRSEEQRYNDLFNELIRYLIAQIHGSTWPHHSIGAGRLLRYVG